MEGSGKYGPEARELMQALAAKGILLSVFGGIKGHGFEIAGDAEFIEKMPTILRDIANQIESDYSVRSRAE